MACYRKTNGLVENFASLVPCGGGGGVTTCCSAGDTCLSNAICHYTEPSDGGSGFYLAGCTDPSYKDPACAAVCSDLPYQDVVYNSTSGLWECCGNQHACGAPVSNETFKAMPPTQLQVLGATPANATAGSSNAPSAASSAGPSAVSSDASGANSGLSIAAAVGIAVASTVLVLLLLGLAIWRIVAYRQRRAQQRQQQPTHGIHTSVGYDASRGSSTVSTESRQEFLGDYPRVHLIDGSEKSEMEG